MLTFRYIDRQKYNHMKPILRLQQEKRPEERKKLAREWIVFAGKCVIKERRSKNSGVVLSGMNKEKRTRCSADLQKLLPLKFDNKLPDNLEPNFSWLLQIFNQKDLTEIINKASYDFYKTSKLK